MSKEQIRYFRTVFLEEVSMFLKTLDKKAASKILYNIDFAEHTNGPRLFKKLSGDIWEFRIKYCNLQYRLLAFWDTNGEENTLVIVTHGIIKKSNKLPLKDLLKAGQLRLHYFSDKGK